MSKKKPAADPVAPTAPKSNLKFLIVDDDNGARQTLIDYLKFFGFDNIVECKDGDEAVAALKAQKIDLIISDWEMPGKNGLELLKVIRGNDDYQAIPFIMVASPISKERMKVMDAAMNSVDGYIIKPFRAEVLRDKIDRALADSTQTGPNGALVVDDNDEIRQTIVEYLKKMGYAPIFEAKDGDEGFTVLKANAAAIAFVVSDWEMPKMAGIDLLRNIRSDDVIASMPFIMCTSQVSIERIKLKQAMDAHVDNYLLKPFRMDDLKSKIEMVLKKAKVQTSVERDFTHGQDCIEISNWSEAIKAFNRVVSADPSNVEAYLGLAKAHKYFSPEKGIEKAMQYIRQVIVINPAFPRAHIELAMTYESAMSLEKAIACLKEALKTCSFSEEIHYHLGRLLLRRGLKDEGYEEIKKALEIKPDFEEAQKLLGEQ